MKKSNAFILTEKVRAIANEGLFYAKDPYDIKRYEFLINLTTKYLSSELMIDRASIKTNFLKDYGCITPKLGVIVPIFNKSNKYLILRRRDDHKWCFPCGFVDLGDDINTTSIKEVKEETGLKITPIGIMGISSKGPDIYEDIAHYQINLIVKTKCIGSHEKIVLSYEHIDYKWISLSEKREDYFWHSGHEKVFRYMNNRRIDTIPLNIENNKNWS